MSLIGCCLIIISIYLLKRLRDARDARYSNSFLFQESIRYFFKRNEVQNDWTSHGKLCTSGISLVQNKITKRKKFLKQSELCDVSILDSRI